MTNSVRFQVLGRPAPQGSKVRTRYSVRESSEAVLPWREAVKAAAALEEIPTIPGPVDVEILAYFTRPASHYGTGRNAGTLKRSAPPFPTQRPYGDVDKLARSTLDALTDAAVLKDDSSVVTLRVTKLFADPARGRHYFPGAWIAVTECASWTLPELRAWSSLDALTDAAALEDGHSE